MQAEDGIRDLVRSRGLGDVYKRQASNSANKSAPSSALPGRHEAKITSAMQIQPRPCTMVGKKLLKAAMVRKAPPSAISADPAITAPMRIKTGFRPDPYTHLTLPTSALG